MKQYLNVAFSMFVFLGILLIPFTWNLISFQIKLTRFIFGSTIQFLENSLDIGNKTLDLSSDSSGLYILFSLLLILSLIITVSLSFCKIKQENINWFLKITKLTAVYFLSVILLKYGFDKLFKAQFYLPEPNILYTPVGKLDKDMLFWTSMGTSYSYNIFMGLAEIIPAILFFFKKTRSIGLLISFGVLLNVFAINMSFDISVKVLSGFLLMLNCYLLVPTMKVLWNIFILKNNLFLGESDPSYLTRSKKLLLKSLLVVVIFSEALIPYFKSGNFQDDLAPRPFLHGAYDVEFMVQNGDTLAKMETPIKRIFVHRDGYLIFQDHQDEMEDYKLEIDRLNNQLILTDYELNKTTMNYSYSKKDGLLILSSVINGISKIIKTKTIKWQQLPALQQKFHWSLD